MYIFPSNCFIVMGASRALILDYARRTQYFISNELAVILSAHGAVDDYLIDKDAFDILISKDLLVEIQESDLNVFSDYPLGISLPYTIGSVIFEWGSYLEDDDILLRLQTDILCLGIKYVEVFYINDYEFNLDAFFKFIAKLEHTLVESIDVHISVSSFSSPDVKVILEQIKANSRQLRLVYIYGSSSVELFQIDYCSVLNQTQVDRKCCGVVHQNYFSNNPWAYNFSRQENSCLSHKISINNLGEIKNCPSTSEVYGNIATANLVEAIMQPHFKKYWKITKDQIQICKDCEFRYICTDCRAYVETPGDLYSKPLKCGYDPYTCTWQEWSTHPLKQSAIESYELQDVVRSRQERLHQSLNSDLENSKL
jgi:SPASM domain peptide maturase of grasp-with-spasm system